MCVFMRHELLRSLNLRLASLVLALPVLLSCDALDFNGENISPAESFPIIYVKRSVQALAEPIDPVGFVAGGDLYWRDAASASAEEINLTSSQTSGRGDVSSPEISYDGTQVVFSMRRPADNSWNIWLLNVNNKQLTQVLADDEFDDLHPHFLVDGRIVFSSNRQTKSRRQLENNFYTVNNLPTEAYSSLDPIGRHQSSLLHIMNADGSDVDALGSTTKQISFHTGHDRDVTLLSSGKLMFNRWEATGQRNHFPIIMMNPDGTAIETLYGAYSKGNSFFSPRELANGNLVAIHAPASGAHGGGALIEIDVKQFGDFEDRVRVLSAGAEAQKQISFNPINIEPGVSTYGRFLSPYPVFDNTNRILVSWSASNRTEVTDLQSATTPATTKIVEGNPSYGIYMMDLTNKNMTPIVTASNGVIAYDAIAVQSRIAAAGNDALATEQNRNSYILPAQIDDAFSGVGGTLVTALEAADEGVIHVRSVYDTDSNDLLAPSMMVPTLPIPEVIPQIAAELDDTRSMIADIVTIKDLAQTSVEQRPARFVRVTKAVAVPEGAGQDMVGEAGSVMQQILGYSEVEPDGSVLFKVPADTPVAISVLDANGRAITNHTSWLHVRPGEVLECAGCHSPRKRTPLNVFPIAGNNPIVQLGSAQINETMAETRARIQNGDSNDPASLNPDIFYTDIWVTDIVQASAVAGTPIALGLDIDIDYTLLATPAPANGVINFVDHIQPILNATGANCVACHNGTQVPDLRNIPDPNDGIIRSYKNLVKSPVDLDLVAPFNPVVNLKDGAYLTQRLLPYVRVGGPRETSRSSYLMEKLSNTELLAPRALSGGTNHAGFLNPSELRVFTEWMDTGANYYNSPFGPDVDAPIGESNLSEVIGVITDPPLDEFTSNVYPILMNQCASCHMAVGNKSDFDQRIVTSTLVNVVPSENTLPRFILTGDVKGDYRAAISFIEDRATAAQSSLVVHPLSTGSAPVHPQVSDGLGGFGPVISGPDATIISDWITP